MQEFLLQYFWNPIFSGEGYNVYNTIVYAGLLILSLYIIKTRWKMNEKWFWSLIPFILFGGVLRTIQDAIAYKSFWLITPGIYITIFTITIVTIIITKKDPEKTKKIGFGLLLLSLLPITWFGLKQNNFPAFLAIITMSLILGFVMKKALETLKIGSKQNVFIAFGQMLDASATSIAITFFGYGEQHVLSGFLTGIHPFLFAIIKMVVVIIALYVIEKDTKDKQWKHLLKLVVLILGLAPGTRDLLRLFLGV